MRRRAGRWCPVGEGMTFPVTTGEYRVVLAAQMKEAALQAQVARMARALGWLTYHTHDSRRSDAGFPDLVLVNARQGRLLFRELKTVKGRLRPEQQLWLEALGAAGFDAGVWRPGDLLDGVVEAELRGGGSG